MRLRFFRLRAMLFRLRALPLLLPLILACGLACLPAVAEQTPPPFDPTLVPAPDADGVWGYVDAASGAQRIEPNFIEAGFFHHGLALISRPIMDMPVQAIDDKGQEVTVYPCTYGLTNPEGRPVLETSFTAIEPAYADNADVAPELRRLFRVAQGPKVSTWNPKTNRVHPDTYPIKPKSGVFHADRGWLLPPGDNGFIQFHAGGIFSYNGNYDIHGKILSPPPGFVFGHLFADRGAIIIKSAEPDREGPGSGETDNDKAGSDKTDSAKSASAKAGARLPQFGLVDFDGQIIVPGRYTDVDNMPGPGFWVASRPTEQGLEVLRKAYKKLQAGGDIDDVPEDADITQIDIYNGRGDLVRSLNARYSPSLDGDEVSYQQKGQKRVYNVRSGEDRALVQEPPALNPPEAENLIFEENGRYGVKNRNGSIGIKAEYGLLQRLGDDLFIIAEKFAYYEDNIGLVDHQGREILPRRYGGIYSHLCRGKSMLTVKSWRGGENNRGGVGVADLDGRLLTPLKYMNSISFRNNDQAVVSDGHGRGVIDCMGREVIPGTHKSVFDVKSGEDLEFPYYQAENNQGLWGLYDLEGKEVLPFRYGFIRVNKEPWALGWLHTDSPDRKLRGAVNLKTGVELPPVYGGVLIYEHCLVTTATEDERKRGRRTYTLRDLQGAALGEYDRFFDHGPNKDVFVVSRDDLYGLLDAWGRELVPLRYSELGSSKPGFWRAWSGEGNSVYIDRSGREYRLPQSSE